MKVICMQSEKCVSLDKKEKKRIFLGCVFHRDTALYTQNTS